MYPGSQGQVLLLLKVLCLVESQVSQFCVSAPLQVKQVLSHAAQYFAVESSVLNVPVLQSLLSH